MSKILYLDCFSGVAGDMILSALVDAGASRDHLLTAIRQLTNQRVDLRFESVTKNGAEGLHLELDPPEEWTLHTYPELRNRLVEVSLPEAVVARSTEALDRLADVEADFHGCEPEEVHFDEIAGFDLLLDLAGAAVCLEEMDVDRMLFSDLPVSSGWLDSHHGRLPVPAPATLELLKGFRVYDSGLDEEITTPTGAAILTTMGEQVDGMPDLSVTSIGYGAGTKNLEDRPNLLRAVTGTTEEGEGDWPDRLTPERIAVLETNIDDDSPEQIAHAMEVLMDNGALDVCVTPVTMKKSRSGSALTVLCFPSDQSRMLDVLFQETTTFGVRTDRIRRVVLPRSTETVETPWGSVPVKIGRWKSREKIAPEFEACRRLAKEHDCSLREVMESARRAYRNMQ